MIRTATVLVTIALSISVSVGAWGQDTVQKDLDRAKSVYQNELTTYQTDVLDAFERREETARKAADKKLIAQIKSERDAFEKCNAVPNGIPVAISKRRIVSRTKLETAYTAAIKARIRAKDDEGAAALEAELKTVQFDLWPHLDLGKAKVVGDAFQVNKFARIFTKEEFSGPIEINAVARTEKDNIRFRAYRGSCVIFNWEAKSGELRATRPDGSEQESGSIAASLQRPLKPGVWYRLRWRLTDDGMQVFVNDDLVFAEDKPYMLTAKQRIDIGAVESVLEVRDFHVIPLKKE
ncbi:MAG: hypothetical protein WCJ09_22845 [Planctomycetota bacterium]